MSSPRFTFFRTALAFEGGLGLAVMFVGWVLDFSPFVGPPLSLDYWQPHAIALGLGLLAAVPMVALVPILDRAPLPGLHELRSVVHEQLVPLVRSLNPWQMAVVSLAAGWGEELLFRGLVQTGLETWLHARGGWWIGLSAGTVLFGLCHFITPSYAVLAGLMGLYLGLLQAFTGNLLAPIAAHALYDFAALVYLARSEPLDLASDQEPV